MGDFPPFNSAGREGHPGPNRLPRVEIVITEEPTIGLVTLLVGAPEGSMTCEEIPV
jgi:hypothetical protein